MLKLIRPVTSIYKNLSRNAPTGTYKNFRNREVCPCQFHKYWSLVLLLLLLLVNFTFAQPENVCRISNRIGNGTYYATGTLIDNDTVITCSHTFDEGVGQVSCCFGSKGCYLAKIISRDTVYDVAVLQVSNPPCRPVKIAVNWPRPGEAIYVGGFGRNGVFQIRKGKVVGYTSPTNAQRHWVLVTGRSNQGESGGPILNSQGELVGVLWGHDDTKIYGSYCGRIRLILQTCFPRRRYIITTQQPVTCPTCPVQPQTPTPAPPGTDIYATEANCQSRFETTQAQIDALRASIAALQQQIININNNNTNTNTTPDLPLPPPPPSTPSISEITAEVKRNLPPITFKSTDGTRVFWQTEAKLGDVVALPGIGVRHQEKIATLDNNGNVIGYRDGEQRSEKLHLGDILTVNEYPLVPINHVSQP